MTVVGISRAPVATPLQRDRALYARNALASFTSDAASRLITLALLSAAAVELVTLRLGLRSAVHIPGLTPLDGAAGLGAEVGRFAFSLATVLVLLLLIILAIRAARRASLADMAAAAGISAMLLGAAGATAGAISDLALGAFSLAGLGLLLPRAAFASGPAGAATLIAMTAGFALASMVVLLPLAGGGVPTVLLPLGEGLALGGAVASPLLLGRVLPSHRALALAALAGLGTLALLLGDPALAKNLTLWTFGLAGYFPAFVYAAAASSLTYTALVAYQAGRLPVAVGVGLLAIGGIGLHNTYQTALVVAGLALLGERLSRPALRTR